MVDALTTILNDLEHPEVSSNLISLDFEKAFNRLDHGACLDALRRHGTSQLTYNLVESFLTNRRMCAKIGNHLFSPRKQRGAS